MAEPPVIVSGTTPDYVIKIHKKGLPGPLFFLMDTRYRNNAELADIDRSLIMFSNLADFDETLASLDKFLSNKMLKAPWFACFDCESLLITSRLAEHYKRPFYPSRSILLTRNKFLAGKIWRNSGLNNPGSGLASDLEQTIKLFKRFNRDTVLKPLSGSGSELLFHCHEEHEIVESVKTMISQLSARKHNSLFKSIKDPFSSHEFNPCETWIVEEFVEGPEFSCDFILQDNKIRIVRETAKIKDPASSFGTVLCYTVPPAYPVNFSGETLKETLKLSVQALEYNCGYFMADYIIRDDGLVSMIEITPRPGGDSIPDLVTASTGEDTIKTYIEFMCGQRIDFENEAASYKPCASINFFAHCKGVIGEIDYTGMLSRNDFITFIPRKTRGDRVYLPPDDYDNRLIGYCIVSHDTEWDPVETCRDYQNLLEISIY